MLLTVEGIAPEDRGGNAVEDLRHKRGVKRASLKIRFGPSCEVAVREHYADRRSWKLAAFMPFVEFELKLFLKDIRTDDPDGRLSIGT